MVPTDHPLHLNVELELVDEPEALLEVRYSEHNPQHVEQVLIKWLQLPNSEATWECHETMAALFSAFHL